MALKRVVLAIPYSQQALIGIGNYLASHRRWRVDWSLTYAWQLSSEKWANYPGDGIIIQAIQPEPLEVIAASGRPAVNISDSGWDAFLPTVCNNNLAIGQMGAEHLLERGYRHFVFCSDSDMKYTRERLAGFRRRLQSAGYRIATHTLQHKSDGSTQPDKYIQLGEFLKSQPKPLGLMCDNDSTAHVVARTCLEYQVHVPEEVAILGVDNDVARCNIDLVPLSSIVTDMQTVGYKAAGLLDRIMQGEDIDNTVIEVPPLKVQVRQSTDTLAIDDPLLAQALTILRDEVDRQIAPEELARRLDISRRTLDRRFKLHLGQTVADRIQWHRLERVKQLLRETTFPMAEIAERSGFTDINHLGHAFRREVGISPSDYRAQFQETPAGPRR